MLTRPNPLIEAFVANRAKSGFLAPNTNQFRAPFIDLKPLNGHLFHAIVEFKGFGFVGMAFSRLALGNSGAIQPAVGPLRAELRRYSLQMVEGCTPICWAISF